MTRHRSARALATATHLAPTLTVTGFATALALAAGAGWLTVLIAAAVLTGQASVGWSNDWIDANRDKDAGRTDKPTVTGALRPAVLRTYALAALAVSVGLSLVTWPAGWWHVLALVSAWMYNLRLKATAGSPLPYAVSFAALVTYITTTAGTSPTPGLLVATAALGVGAHFANTLPDLDADRAGGVVGLPHRLGHRGATTVSGTLLVAATAVVLDPHQPWAVAAGCCAAVLAGVAVVTATRRPGSRTPFLAAMGVAGVCVGMVVAGAART